MLFSGSRQTPIFPNLPTARFSDGRVGWLTRLTSIRINCDWPSSDRTSTFADNNTQTQRRNKLNNHHGASAASISRPFWYFCVPSWDWLLWWWISLPGCRLREWFEKDSRFGCVRRLQKKNTLVCPSPLAHKNLACCLFCFHLLTLAILPSSLYYNRARKKLLIPCPRSGRNVSRRVQSRWQTTRHARSASRISRVWAVRFGTTNFITASTCVLHPRFLQPPRSKLV